MVPTNSSDLSMASLSQPFIFPYGKEMEKYDTPCVRRCLDDGTVLGMCVRSCDLTPVRRHVTSNNTAVTKTTTPGSPFEVRKISSAPAPVRSIHLSQPEPYAPMDVLPTPKNDTGEVPGEMAVAGDPAPVHMMMNDSSAVGGEGEDASQAPIRQFVDEEGNILEQHQVRYCVPFIK